MHHSVIRSFSHSVIALLLTPLALFADTVDFKGATINYTGAEVSWPDGSSGDVVFTFTDTATPGTLALPSFAKAWILSVGGGGAGGSVAQNTTANGMGGGGGAGGFVECPPEIISGGTYTIVVGKGGLPGTDTAGTLAAGQDGTASKINTNNIEIAKYTAPGGGGGGAESAGRAGASGGGGSMTGGATSSGGTGIEGKGFGGGDGSFAKSAGGGGGAGEPGDPPSKSGVSGAGGDGMPCGISCAAGAEPLYYAGGGSAGVPTGSVPDAGLGGGGKGGGGKNGKGYLAEAGIDGLGGGGGGGTHAQIGGKGGDGVVIIRLSLALAGDPVKPVAPEGLHYTGENIVGVQPSIAYEIEGTANATNAATYHCTVTLHDGFSWSDGTKDVVTVDWTIHPKEIEKPVAPTLTYNKGNQVAIESPDEALVFSGLGEGNNCTNATDAGSYFYLVDLKSANYVWKGAEEGHERDQVRVGWSIAPMRITLPVLYENLVYNGQFQSAFDTDQMDEDACEFSDDSTYDAKDAGDYEFTLILKNTETVKNYVWWINDAETYDDQTLDWSIAKAPNAITSLKLEGWKVGGAPNAPSCTATWGAETAVYKYAAEEDAAPSQWSADPPDEAGNWFVWAHIEATDNWAAADKKKQFTLWDNPEQIFRDHVTITVANTAGKAFTDYPLTLALREDDPAGFSYARAGENGDALVFISADGTMLSYKIENWSVSGESKVTVYIKSLSATGTSVDFYWCLREGQEVPAQPERPASPAKPDAKVTSSYGIVERDGLKVDSWDPAPTMTPTLWDVGESPTIITNVYRLKSGAAVTACFYNIYDPAVTNFDFSQVAAATNGSYRALFTGADRDDYEPIAYTIPFAVVGHSPTIDITGNKGDSGRVLLMNNDNGDATHPAVDYQGWYDADESNTSGAKKSDTSTFWQFLNQDEGSTFNLKAGTESILWTQNYGRKLWHLKDCRHGNTYEKGDTKSTPTMNKGQNYLSWSSTSRRITEHRASQRAANPSEVGQAVMRNILDAAVYSPVYTNHVGTIYFDAVNGWTKLDDGKGGENYFQIVVEAATETKDGEPVTEENSHSAYDEGVYDYANITNWTPLAMYPVHVKGETLTPPLEPTPKFGLDVTTGGAKDEFYRIYVPVPEEIGRKPMRFRIRRVSMYTSTTPHPDDSSLILLDNILVSYPPMTATVEGGGWNDPLLKGKQTLGWECSTSVDFPSLSDAKVLAQARGRYYVNDGDPNADPNRFVAAATMHYRWRYLNQSFGSWGEVDLDPVDPNFTATTPLVLPGAIGDVEYWFETRFQAPYYAYADYSGCKLEAKFKEVYTEEKTVSEARLRGENLASTGTDWFFRLRQGASPNEGVDVLVTGAIGSTNAMELVGDNLWRALVPIPRDAAGDFAFSFRSRRPGDETKSNLVTTAWGAAPGAAVLSRIPTNGDAAEGGAAVTGAVDHVASYYEIKFNDRFRTWEISRAEYQNFNHWNDAAKDYFCVNVRETNGVDDVKMKTEVMKDYAVDWEVFSGENPNWNEPFILVNYKDPGYPKEVVFPSHVTPAKWNAYNLSFVSKNLISKTDYDRTSENVSGLAAKLRGEAAGSIEFTKADCPKGLSTVNVSARIGQSVSFDQLNYSGVDLYKKDYTFLTPVFMSNAEGKQDGKFAVDSDNLTTMAVGASVSVFAYYRESRGCYELRVSRDVKGAYLHAVLYKWCKENGTMVSRKLGNCDYFFDGVTLWTNNKGQAAASDRLKSFALFISAETKANGTEIKAGFSTGSPTESHPFSPGENALEGKTFTYSGLYCLDTDSPHTSGTYGVAAKDCPAAFVLPRHYDEPVGDITVSDGRYFTNQGLTFTDRVMDSDDLRNDKWELNGPVRSEIVDGYRQIYVPELTQNLELWLQARPNGDWVRYGTKEVKGYAFRDYSYSLHLTGQWNLRLRTGEANVDVAVGSVEQVQWQAKDVESIDYRSDEFVYTQGCVLENAVEKRKEVLLQPSRGLATTAMSVRSPVLHGLGRVAFDYSGVNTNAEIWVQVATNAVEYSLTGDGGYNSSIESVPLGEPADIGVWMTVTNFTYATLGSSGSKTVYLGWHDQAEAPVTGIFRVFIPPTVIERAIVAATNRTEDVDYGRITITGMTVTDEPGLSDRAWRGWNLRMVGDRTDSEKRMYLFDTTLDGEDGNGLDCGLNNSVNDIDPLVPSEEAKSGYPAIYSPTMRSADGGSGVGSVSFKARLYGTSANPEKASGKVTLYGSASSLDVRWTKVAEFTVSSPVFQDFPWVAGDTTYAAMKFEITDPGAKTTDPKIDRVIIDEIVIGERVDPTLGFVYAAPFRMNLMEAVEITDVLSINEQPLAGENWGVQTKLSLQQLSDEIDVERGFQVYLSYFVGQAPWGYEHWKDESAAVKRIRLTQVGDASNLVFRSVGDTPESLVPPIDKGGTIVQFQVIAKFWDRGGRAYERSMRFDDWRQPDWFWPIDRNAEAGASKDRNDLFSPYTVLDTVSPGRAWINEVNWNDGPQSENGGETPVTNQFIEICVPSGVDMDGWYLRATDLNLNKWVMARFGHEIPAVKTPTLHAVEGFEFVVLESPETQMAGGIRDEDGNPAADGTWAIDGPGGTADSGTLSFNRPWQFELVRPSGIVEHQFVAGGTNTLAKYSYGGDYEATNLLAKLNADAPSPKRFLAGTDYSRTADRLNLASLGVVGGTSTADPAPGEEGTWLERMRFTPGRLNDGQVIPPGWYLPPNGTNSWVTFTLLGPHLHQAVGEETNVVVKVVVPQGQSTNVTYRADPWYEVAALTVDGVTNETHRARGGAEWTYTLTPTGQMCNVTATEGVDSRLDDPAFGLRGSPYAPAVVNWLAANWPEATPEDIRLGAYKGLGYCDQAFTLSLVDMYWLDIPPVPETEAELANAEAGGTNWWLRGGITELRADQYVRTRQYAVGEVAFTNSQVDLKLYISNAVDHAAWAPRYLQGLNNERSSDYSGRWNSETLQILGNLELSQKQGFMPFRCFVFDGSSFSGADAEKPFTATIEILDPFSTESPGYGYGWSGHKGTGFYFKWALSTNSVPNTIQTLKANDTYD